MSLRIAKKSVGSSAASIDRLEGRAMLSGNVSASVVDGVLVIRDALANAIVMDRAGLTTTQVRISSGTNATSINGAAGPLVLNGVAGLKASMGDGDDRVVANGLTLSGGASVAGGAGNNTVAFNVATIAGGLGVSNASNLTLRRVKVGGATKIVSGARADTVKIDDSTFNAVSIDTGLGADIVQVEIGGTAAGVKSVFKGSVKIALGGGTDRLQVGLKGQAGNHATFQGPVRFNGGLQRDTLIHAGAAALPGGSVVSFESINPTSIARVNLRTARTFAVLAGAGVSNTGGTIINGNLGTSPTGTITGAPTINGQTHAANPIAAQAKLDLTVAYNDAKGRTGPTIVLPGELSGLTLAPGLYKNSSSVKLSSGAVTIDAKGNPDAIFIFQIGSTLTTISGTRLILAGGAKASNIFWQVGSSATLGTNSSFKGTILANQSITLTSGATLGGRALARIGAVVLDANKVNVPTA